MGGGLRGRLSVSKLSLSEVSITLSHLYSRKEPILPLLLRSHSFSSIHGGGGRGGAPSLSGEQFRTDNSSSYHNNSNNDDGEFDSRNSRNKFSFDDDDKGMHRNTNQNPPEPIPNRPLRRERPANQSQGFSRNRFGNDDYGSVGNKPFQRSSRELGGNRTSPKSLGSDMFKFDEFDNDGVGEKMRRSSLSSQPRKAPNDNLGNDFLEKFKLAPVKPEKPSMNEGNSQLPKEEGETKGDKVVMEPPPPPQDADEIFKRMKETGLIPNAVAMLDGLCKDGLVQEAMKLFGSMREKGTIPEVVIYTAVVEGFCKALKFDDAKRIFRKMQNNGITPNTFSYTVLIQGLYRGRRLEDAIEFCVEMLEAGHSPNLATFTGLVDEFCKEKGVEEAQRIVGALKQKGFHFDERAVKEYLEKKGPFSQLVWEAISGKKSVPTFF